MSPIFVNPNCPESVKEVLHHIGKISKIKQYCNQGEGTGNCKFREWVIIRCDGLPYVIIRKILSEDHEGIFSWVVLRTGLLHEEINATKLFVGM